MERKGKRAMGRKCRRDLVRSETIERRGREREKWKGGSGGARGEGMRRGGDRKWRGK